MVINAVKSDGWITKITEFIFCKVFRFKRKANDIGLHLDIKINPIAVFSTELYYFRIRLFFPPYCSISFGKQGTKGFQVSFGLKYDPTSKDYLPGINVRINLLGHSKPADDQASF